MLPHIKSSKVLSQNVKQSPCTSTNHSTANARKLEYRAPTGQLTGERQITPTYDLIQTTQIGRQNGAASEANLAHQTRGALDDLSLAIKRPCSAREPFESR